MKGILEGDRLSLTEAEQLTYAAGWRAKGLATAGAIWIWESALYTRARLDYEWWADRTGQVYAWENGILRLLDGIIVGSRNWERLVLDPRVPDMDYDGLMLKRVYRLDMGLCQINSLHKPLGQSIESWEAEVYDPAGCLVKARALAMDRRERGLDPFGPWMAYTGGNYKKSYRLAKHVAANVDPAWYTNRAITFRWFQQKWIPGDRPVWDQERKRRGAPYSTDKWQREWSAKHMHAATILLSPTLGVFRGEGARTDVMPLKGHVGVHEIVVV